MTRRDINWLIARAAATAGAAQFLPAWQHHSGAPPDPHVWQPYNPKFFSSDDFRALTAFTEILIPTDDTPGAKEANVAAFIDFVVNAAAEFAPEVQENWRGAMRSLHAARFGELSPADQLAVVTDMSVPGHSGHSTFELIKEMTVRGFYTARVGLIDVLGYQGNAYLTEFPACTHPEHTSV